MPKTRLAIPLLSVVATATIAFLQKGSPIGDFSDSRTVAA